MFSIKDELKKAINLFIQEEYVPAYANAMASCYVAFGCMDCSNRCAEKCSNKCKENAKK